MVKTSSLGVNGISLELSRSSFTPELPLLDLTVPKEPPLTGFVFIEPSSELAPVNSFLPGPFVKNNQWQLFIITAGKSNENS